MMTGLVFRVADGCQLCKQVEVCRSLVKVLVFDHQNTSLKPLTMMFWALGVNLVCCLVNLICCFVDPTRSLAKLICCLVDPVHIIVDPTGGRGDPIRSLADLICSFANPNCSVVDSSIPLVLQSILLAPSWVFCRKDVHPKLQTIPAVVSVPYLIIRNCVCETLNINQSRYSHGHNPMLFIIPANFLEWTTRLNGEPVSLEAYDTNLLRASLRVFSSLSSLSWCHRRGMRACHRANEPFPRPL